MKYLPFAYTSSQRTHSLKKPKKISVSESSYWRGNELFHTSRSAATYSTSSFSTKHWWDIESYRARGNYLSDLTLSWRAHKPSVHTLILDSNIFIVRRDKEIKMHLSRLIDESVNQKPSMSYLNIFMLELDDKISSYSAVSV